MRGERGRATSTERGRERCTALLSCPPSERASRTVAVRRRCVGEDRRRAEEMGEGRWGWGWRERAPVGLLHSLSSSHRPCSTVTSHLTTSYHLSLSLSHSSADAIASQASSLTHRRTSIFSSLAQPSLLPRSWPVPPGCRSVVSPGRSGWWWCKAGAVRDCSARPADTVSVLVSDLLTVRR